MKWQTSCSLLLVVVAAPAMAQETIKKPIDSKESAPAYQEIFQPAPNVNFQSDSGDIRDPLAGDRDFQNFIGFVSNPTLSLDPRALTQIWPVFGDANFTGRRRFEGGTAHSYGAGLSVALSERFVVGLSKGGYAETNFFRNRDGWLDLGGFAQYSLIRDVENQFIFSVGAQVLTPWLGSSDLFQGTSPSYLAPYFTFGKEFGEFHILGTAGYQFSIHAARANTQTGYANLHFDRRFFGWLYGLVEFNGALLSRNPPERPALDTIRGFTNLGRFDQAGGILTIAPGVNAVIIQNRLEIGAVYETPLYSEKDLWFHSMLVKMILRY